MDDFAEEEVVENPTLRAAYNLAPLHQNQPLRWDYKVHLIGEKINDKMIHLCEVCELPILVYGRIMPCKHVFCFDCACKCDKVCKRCGIKIRKVEKSALGTVFVCTHGAPKHSKEGCRRSYLSQRDLKAHHVHRHVPKSSTDGAMSPSASTPAQPVPNQLPLTKQQAAQQASQKQVVTPGMSHSSPGQSHIQSSVLPVQNSMVPPASGLYLQQSSSLPVGSQHMSPVPPLIPGLGDLRTIVTMAQPIIGQNSPLVQTSSGSSTLSQGMNLPYSSAAQANTDVFRPVEMVQQQAMGAPGSHLQSNQSLPAYQQTAQFPVSTPIMQQISSQQLSSTAAGQLHPSSFIHTLPPLPVPQSLDCYGEPQSMNSSAQMSQQPRTNLNLITVPIQDEGQYRPLPNVTSPLNPHFGTSYPQTRPSMPGQTQSYTQPPLTPGTFSTPATFPQMAAQPQNMTAPNSPQSLQFNQPGALHPNSPGLMINPRQGLGGGVHPGVPRALADVMNVLAIRAQGAGMIPTQVGGMPAQVGGMPAQVGGMPTQSAGVLSTQGGGLMPTPGTGGQGMVNRFPPGGRWTAPRIIQPRMTQGQQRPHNDGQFNQSGYYH